ncbi:hypothetical protein CO044_00590 [Candidatus Peregrinibacteria bacterium CG_4_9_14_0_2_um_filter_38_9]|nr:MAG: hypothetical protein CO044_00590 [Candidatus Peregrinibacteria bacterium CG_4_9_14_0_2_um_filter_38_9]
MKEIENKLWIRARKYIKILQIVPFVRMVSVCNNLAFGLADEKSDIDLFIVARTGRLFIVRTFVTLIFNFFGVRRHGEKIHQRFCLSFFVDDSALDLSKMAIDNDIYLAYWIKSQVPFINDGVSLDLLKKNEWVKKYFENEDDFFIRANEILPVSRWHIFFRFVFEFLSSGYFGEMIEWFLKKWQMKRALRKAKKVSDASGIVVSEHVLKFHNIDRRKSFRDLWGEKYGESKITDSKILKLYF